jgi:hypothetical protein
VRARRRLIQHSGQTIIEPHSVTRALSSRKDFRCPLYPWGKAAKGGRS